MRTLVISHGHPAFSIGGAEIAAHNMFRALNALPGHEAHFLARTGHPVRRRAETPLMSLRQGEREIFLHADAYEHFWLSNAALDDLSGAFSDHLRALNPDVVHFHHIIGLGVEAIAAAKRAVPDARIVVTFHEYLSICAHHGQMVKTKGNRLCRQATPADCAACFPERTAGEMFRREMFLKHHLGLADAFVSPSRFLVDRYVDWGLDRSRFTVIENGLDTSHSAPPRPIPAGGRRARFGFFGQVTEFKGLPMLLDAVSRVPDAAWGDDAALCVFGGNLDNQPVEFREKFGRLMERAGRRAKFYGAYRAEELPRLMGQVDWVVMPSIWWENSPLVIQESFLHGRPLLCSDIGGMAEKVRDGVDGLHFRAGSAEDLADTLVRAMSEPGLWERLRDARPTPPSLRDFAEAHAALYRSLRPTPATAPAIEAAPRRRVNRAAIPRVHPAPTATTARGAALR